MMNEPMLKIRPRAVSDYLRYRYQIQPGQGLCLVLGQPDAGCNYRALEAWAHGAVHRTSTLAPDEQLQAIENELNECMHEAGLVDDQVEAREVSAAMVTRLFEARYSAREARDAEVWRQIRSARKANNVVSFPRGGNHD